MKKMKLLLSAFYLITSHIIAYNAVNAHAYANSNNFRKLELQDINGNLYDINTNSDTVNVVFFSTTWCCHCPYVGNSLSNLAQKINGQKVRFFYVLIGHESDAQVKEHFHNYNGNVVICKSIPSLKVSDQVSSVPCCMVFDKNGRMVFRYDGKKDYNCEEFKQLLIGLAKANPPYMNTCKTNSSYYKIRGKVVSNSRKNDKIRRNTKRFRRSTLSKKSKTAYHKNVTQKRA